MTVEDFTKAIESCLKDADKLTDLAPTLIDDYKNVQAVNEAFTQQVKELTDKNNELRDTNSKLVLKTISIKPEVPAEETRADRVNKYLEIMKQTENF